MTIINAVPEVFTIGSGGTAVDVPTGVTANMVGCISLCTADGGAVSAVLSHANGTFALIEERAATNMRVATYRATGLVGGDQITVTGNAKTCHWHGFYTDEFDIDSATNSSGVRPGSQATTTTGSVTPASGQRVLVVGAERSTADGTTISSVVSDGAETVTQILYNEEVTSTDTSIYFGTFLASAAAARTVTITHSAASGNGYASLIKLITPDPGGATIYHVASGPTLTAGEAWYVSSTDTLSPADDVTFVA